MRNNCARILVSRAGLGDLMERPMIEARSDQPRRPSTAERIAASGWRPRRLAGATALKCAIVMTVSAVSALTGAAALAGPCTTEIQTLTNAISAKDAGSGATVGAASPPASAGAGQSQHPPAAIMGKEAQSKAASPEDVRRQSEGLPTAADQARTGSSGASSKLSEASAALGRAKTLDAAGREAECMEAVGEAKAKLGT